MCHRSEWLLSQFRSSSWQLENETKKFCIIALFQTLLFIFGGHESFLWGHWYPYFGLLVTPALGFKARVGSALFELRGAICIMLHIPWNSPLVRHLPTSWRLAWWPAWQPSRLFYITARHWWDSKPGAIMPPITVWDQADALATEISRLGETLLLNYMLPWLCILY